MFPYYKDYTWVDGVPHGISRLNNTNDMICYRIVIGPYKKRISLEKYCGDKFLETIYDSQFFDFRMLKPESQVGWNKIILEENENIQTCVIKDQDDRAVLLETYFFENKHCRYCHILLPTRVKIATQKLYYTILDDSLNGVVLFDTEKRPVTYKRYQADHTGNFTELIEEQWDMHKAPLSINKG